MPAGHGVRKLFGTGWGAAGSIRSFEPRRRSNGLACTRQTGFDHRTKMERLATILLPNPVAADDIAQHATDCPAKIRRQINTR
jgi:hypothetical protein